MLTNGMAGRSMRNQWGEGSNRLCMCSNNNATRKLAETDREHEFTTDVYKICQRTIQIMIFDHFLWFGIHWCLWPHTRAATKQLKTSPSKGRAPVSWFLQNMKYPYLISTLNATLTSVTTIHSWEQEKGCTELYNTLILSHFLLKGSSWSTCQSTLDLATDELGKSQNCQKSVFVSSQTVPKISPQICQCDMIVFFCNVHGWFVSNKLFVVSHYLIHWTKTHIDWRATYVCIGKVAHVLRKSPPACTNTKMHKYAQICTN